MYAMHITYENIRKNKSLTHLLQKLMLRKYIYKKANIDYMYEYTCMYITPIF